MLDARPVAPSIFVSRHDVSIQNVFKHKILGENAGCKVSLGDMSLSVDIHNDVSQYFTAFHRFMGRGGLGERKSGADIGMERASLE